MLKLLSSLSSLPMREALGDIWDYIGQAEAICITTNGFVNSQGKCIMGAGVAKQAAARFPWIAHKLGSKIQSAGHQVHNLGFYQGTSCTSIVAFPVKPAIEVVTLPQQVVSHKRGEYTYPAKVPGWALVATVSMIVKSAKELVLLADERDWVSVVLPRPGFGAGELPWVRVKPQIEEILDDRFIVIEYSPK